MIIIEISSKNGQITSLDVTGHSGYAASGSDIVCAGISSLVYAGLNSFDSIDESHVKLDDGLLKLNLNGIKISDHDKIVLDVMIRGFTQIRDQYKKNVKIIKKEN